MLLNDFFTIKAIKGPNDGDRKGSGNTFRATLEINARHRIFAGHFPGQPVVPGACLLQMVKEVTQLALVTQPALATDWVLVTELRLSEADSLKFLAPVDPQKNNLLEMVVTVLIKEEDKISVSANLFNHESVCFKFSGIFQAVKPV